MSKTDTFDRMSKEERAAIIREWSGEKLLQGYEWYYNNFNPLDHARCDTFDLIKSEIRKRILRT